MILDSLPGNQEALRAVLQRRQRYLQARAGQTAERSALRGGGASWLPAMATAGLYLDVAEGAVAIGDFDEARPAIRFAADVLLRLGLPYGAALQRAFVPEDRALRSTGDALLERWARAAPGSEPNESVDFNDAGFADRAFEVPQQHAYRALSLALARGPLPDESLGAAIESLGQWQLVPVGRMRTPMAQYQAVLRYRAGSGEQVVHDEDLLNAVLPDLGELLVTLDRAVRLASRNTYLWSRGLAPAPWFDFDAALLVAVVLDTQELPAGEITERIRSAVPAWARGYASEFVAAVQRLRGEEEPPNTAVLGSSTRRRTR